MQQGDEKCQVSVGEKQADDQSEVGVRITQAGKQGEVYASPRAGGGLWGCQARRKASTDTVGRTTARQDKLRQLAVLACLQALRRAVRGREPLLSCAPSAHAPVWRW